MCLHILLFILFHLLQYSRSEECVLLDRITRQNAWDKVLHRDKLLHYRFTQPPRNQSCIPVRIQFQMKSFAIDEYEGKFVANVWTRLVWKDERLTWSPDDYGGVSKIVVHNTDIWVPSLKLLNTIDPDFFYVEYGECRINHDGEVLCVPQVVYESFCSAKLTDWPYDIQNYTLQFGNGERYDSTKFYFADRAISLFPAEYGNGWNIMAMDSQEDLNSDIQLSISLIMERQANGLVVILVVPCLVISLLTSASILLNVNNYSRLGLLCFSLISHFVFLTTINEFLPKHSADTPVILFFLRSSIILTITSVLVTYILSKIVNRKTMPFEWVSTISSEVFDSFGKYLIIPRWDVNIEIEDANQKNKEIWNNFANILNSVYIVIVVIVYISLFSSYMPKLPPKEY